jgi:DNA helicase HerA-like ATPase
VLNPDNLQLPYWLLNSEEMIEVMIGRNQADKDAQTAILNAAILAAKKKFYGQGVDTNHITVDTPTPYNLSELVRNIDAAMGQLDKPESSIPYLRLKARIERLKNDRRFGFMFSGLMVRDVMAETVSRLLRVPVAGKPITIVDLSGVPSEIVDIVVSLLCRVIFDFAVWSEPVQTLPVLLVCEEAHRYVPAGTNTGFEPTKLVIGRIAKEGRKYGVSLCLVTQRPSELSPGILAQCNTLFALRMSNEQDQEFVRKALPEYGLGLMNALPSLDTQEAVVVGEGVTVPMRLRFDHLDEEYRPRSGSASFADHWHRDNVAKNLVVETIERWRYQERGVPAEGGANAAFNQVRKDLLPSGEQSGSERPAARTPRGAR